jgi:hypothetical protein
MKGDILQPYEKASPKQVWDGIRNLLMAIIYPELLIDPEELESDYHPEVLLMKIYNENPPTYLMQITNQEKISKSARGSYLKTWLTVIHQLFADGLINKGSREKNDALLIAGYEDLKRQAEIQDIEFIEMVGELSRKVCKSHKERIEFFRAYLDGMDEYKEFINAEFKK